MAYAVALLVVILPILVLELAVGQLTGRAPIQAIYNISPVFKGISALILHRIMPHYALILPFLNRCWTFANTLLAVRVGLHDKVFGLDFSLHFLPLLDSV